MYYFENEQHWQDYKVVLTSWIGTPYKHCTCVKQRGADCTLFIAAALVEVGVFTSMPKFEYYPKDWFLHTDNQILLESVKYHTENLLSSNCEFVELPLDTPLMRGDMILFTTRNPEIPNHSGVYWDDQEQFIHCTPWKGVSMRHLQSGYFESRVHNIFRVEEV